MFDNFKDVMTLSVINECAIYRITTDASHFGTYELGYSMPGFLSINSVISVFIVPKVAHYLHDLYLVMCLKILFLSLS